MYTMQTSENKIKFFPQQSFFDKTKEKNVELLSNSVLKPINLKVLNLGWVMSWDTYFGLWGIFEFGITCISWNLQYFET